MLSRVAASIFWMARYVERAENLARFIDVTLNLILDQPRSADRQWAPLVATTGDEAYFQEHYGQPTARNVIDFLAFDREYPNSIISSVAIARENARTVREAISSETWEQLNEFHLFVKRSAEQRIDPTDFLREVKLQSLLFNGTLDATMSHGHGWHFANVGRMLERADKTSRILDVKYFTLLPNPHDVGTTIDDLQWSAVLRSVSGFEMYRKRYHGITVARVVAFLVFDRAFPRAIQFCLGQADESLKEISGPARARRNGPESLIRQLKGEFAKADVMQILNSGLHEFIDALQGRLNAISNGIANEYFSASSSSGKAAAQSQA